LSIVNCQFNFKAAIFDLDGTLLDSMWVWEAVDRAFFAVRCMNMPDDYVQSILALTFRETAEYTIKRFGLCDTPEGLMAEWNELSYLQYCNHVRLKPGAREYLECLSAQGIKLGVATALTTHVMEAVLENNNILHLFDALTSADEVCRGKTFPDIYLLAAQKMGVEPKDCIVFEDVLKTLRGIRAAGMSSCAVWDTTTCDWPEMIREFDMNIMSFEELV
jgi:HAD superfamily hydrolase (TIGR01509 family)